MKVFTVGLDEKEKAKGCEVEKMETGSPTPAPTPTIAVPAVRVHKPSFSYCKGWFSMIVCFFFIIILALTISEISYNRQRDEQFLRLKWAELKQRMLGMELIRQSQAVQQAAQAQHVASQAQKEQVIVQPPEVVDERLAFSKRIGQDDTAQDHPIEATTMKPIVPEMSKENSAVESNDSQSSTNDLRLDFLRAILGRIRDMTQNGFPAENMKVSVIAIKKPFFVDDEEPRSTLDQSLADGFGEWHMPKQFGSHQNEQDYVDYDSQSQMPVVFNRNFDRDTLRGQDRFPSRQYNQESSEMRPWGREFRPTFNDDMNADSNNQHSYDEKPRMKITHHFEKENVMPARIVTELYGDNAENVLKSLLAGQIDSASRIEGEGAQMPPVLQPFSSQNNQQQAPLPMNVQFPLPEQPWLNQNSWQNIPVPQGAMGPFAQPHQPSQQTPQQFAAQFGTAFGQNFGQNWENAQREQQNNWQNQLPQSFTVDHQTAQMQQPLDERPWYHTDAWTQDQKLPAVEPAKPAVPIVSNTAELTSKSEEEHPHFNDIGESEENEGIDNFERKEQFNIPIDIMSKEKSEVVPAAKKFKPNQWMHSQPKEAEETPAAESIDSSASFLPLRDSFKDEPSKEQSPYPEDAMHDDDDFRHNPLFQIDDPKSIRH